MMLPENKLEHFDQAVFFKILIQDLWVQVDPDPSP